MKEKDTYDWIERELKDKSGDDKASALASSLSIPITGINSGIDWSREDGYYQFYACDKNGRVVVLTWVKVTDVEELNWNVISKAFRYLEREFKRNNE